MKNKLSSDSLQNFWNSPDSKHFLDFQVFWKFPLIPRHLANFKDFGNLPKCLGNLRNFPKTWKSRKFPKCLGIWGISQIARHLRNFLELKKTTLRVRFEEFSRIPGIWGILQIPMYLGNSPYSMVLGKLPRFPDNLGISRFLENLRVFYLSIIRNFSKS